MSMRKKIWLALMMWACFITACTSREIGETPPTCFQDQSMCIVAKDMSSPDATPFVMDMSELCQDGEHVVNGQCEDCPAGTIRTAGDDPGLDDTVCDPVECAEHFHVMSHQCVPCSPGSTRPSGDDASGDDTSCDAVICVQNEFVRDHTCEPCVLGMINQAGDDASKSDTMCDPVICAEGEHVMDHQCVSCDSGTSRPAGDNASGDDTMCTSVRCAIDHRVLGHACVPCSSGLTRPAGDDASGEDTTCTQWKTPLFMSQVHTCARMHDRTLKCWGSNAAGQLGLGFREPQVQLTPVTVPGLSQVKDVSLGYHRSCVIVEPRQVKCWGYQGYDEWLGVDSRERFVFIPSDVQGENNAIDLGIPRQGGWSCSIRDTGEVACWGKSPLDSGSVGRVDEARWPAVVREVSTAKRLRFGTFASCALLLSGQTACWGSNPGTSADGTRDNGPTARESHYPAPVIDFALGNSHVCALLDTQEVWCSGNNYHNQINDSEDTIFLSPVLIEDLPSTLQLAVSEFFTCTRGEDLKVRCWGKFSDSTHVIPKIIENLDSARDIQVGLNFGCALLSMGEVACWGRNNHGQLGNGTRIDSVSEATRVSGITKAISIHVGPERACALLNDEQIKCWGNNEYGVLGDGTTQDKLEPISLNL